MNTLRLSTLLLSLAIAVVTLGYATPAFAGKKCDADSDHPSCKDGDDGETSAVYTAELTMGGFIFGPVDVTPSKRGTSYHSDATLDMIRKDGDEGTWDDVFSLCEGQLMLGQINEFMVDNWSINNGGGEDSDIRIRFKDIDVLIDEASVRIDFDLIGTRVGTAFLPAINATSSFDLTKFVIFADEKRGPSCRSGVQYLLVPTSVLEITRTQ